MNRQSTKSHDYMYKIVLIGNSSVGKSSLLKRFSDDTFQQSYLATIGVDFKFKTIQITDPPCLVKLQIWDTAGQQRFRTITSTYYKSANGILLVYDVRKKQSLEEAANFWLGEIKKFGEKDVQIALVGNKIDCQDREVSRDVGQQYAKKQNLQFKEVSAKTGDGVTQIFNTLCKNCVRKFGKIQDKIQTLNVIDDIHKKKAEFQLKSGKDKGKPGNKKCC